MVAVFLVTLPIANFVKAREHNSDMRVFGVAIFFGVLVGGFMGLFASGRVMYVSTVVSFDQRNYPLVALADDNEISGSFVMVFGFGGGGITEKMKYRFYYEDNGIHMKELPAEEVTIQYSDKPSFRISMKREVVEPSPWALFSKDEMVAIGYTLFVPDGSIVKQYNLDLR